MCSIGTDFFDLGPAGANLGRATEIQSKSLSSDLSRSKSRRDTSALIGSACLRKAFSDVLSGGMFEFVGREPGIKARESGLPHGERY